MIPLVRRLVGAWLVLAIAGCGGGNVASRAAQPPEFKPKDQTKCSIAKSQAKPLIVEWPSADRGQLEAQARERGVVVVRYEGCEMRILDRCMTATKYDYAPITRKHDRVVIRDADDLYANVPVGAARLEAKLEKSGELDVDMTLIGRWEASRLSFGRDELQGECDGATHVVTAMSVGSFTFTAGADVTAGADASVLGMGAGGKTSSKRETLNADGDAQACEKSTPDDKGPPANCGALLRVEVAPIAEAGHGVALAPAKASTEAAPASAPLTAMPVKPTSIVARVGETAVSFRSACVVMVPHATRATIILSTMEDACAPFTKGEAVAPATMITMALDPLAVGGYASPHEPHPEGFVDRKAAIGLSSGDRCDGGGIDTEWTRGTFAINKVTESAISVTADLDFESPKGDHHSVGRLLGTFDARIVTVDGDPKPIHCTQH